jgi:hypothetical protein
MKYAIIGSSKIPATEDASFRIAATDHAAYLLVPPLYTSVLPKRTKVEFSFVPLHAGQYEALEKAGSTLC